MAAPDDSPPAAQDSRPRDATPTIRDVARLAAVSIGTASKALNANGRLSLETREKVLRVARELGYRPNDLAQSLHRAKSMTVGILSNDSFGRFSFPIVEALEDRLADDGIAVFMCNATDDPARERQHLDQLLGKRIDGLVVTARRSDKRSSVASHVGGLPVIYVFAQGDGPDSLSLLPDDEGGARLATEHLVGLGRKRIAHLTGPAHFEAVALRHRGYSTALAAAGIAELPGYFRTGKWSEASGREAVAELFDGKAEQPDALFCGNDQIARGALDALRDRGIKVPQEVSVVGFDNWDVMVTGAQPPLTSIDMNLKALGREAGDRLIAMIDGQRMTGVFRLPCTLVVRQSCGGTPTS
ncbi:MAG: LacI family DNA-binding transcriptional regulator [Devosia sp.]|nr:LacI family DNA-binding transcriptional regulator [Devosia sp.]